MRIRTFKPAQRRERGQTMALVALSLFTLVAMAALAIDVTTLYEARTEMQRAANAAALAGAKAFVESGTTTTPTDANLQTLATTIGDEYIRQLLAQNEVGSVAPTLTSTPVRDYTTHPGNPQITVTLQRTDVPTFFARIFGRRLATVRATAIAEAYNSSAPAGGGGNMPPVAPACVKPWLIPNADPNNTGNPFIDETTGQVTRNTGVYPTGVVGEKLVLRSACGTGGIGCAVGTLFPSPTTLATAPNVLQYFPATLANTANGTCPSCAGGSNYEQSSACCDTGNAQMYQCGTAGPGIALNLAAGIVNDTVTSIECVIGAASTGPNNGQDQIGLGPGAQPPADSFGNFLADNGRDPIDIIAGAHSFRSGQHVNTSPSIVTVPIIKSGGLLGVALNLLSAQVEGYMQAFVEETNGPGTTGEIDLYVLNISGCGPNVNPALTPVTAGGASPVPVRLVRP